MMRIINIITCAIAIIALHTGCKHDHLYYATSKKATIKVEVDWTNAQTTPNGVTAIAYHADGTLYAQFPTQVASQPLYLQLPEGEFDIVFYNNNDVEHGSVEFQGKESITTLSAVAKAKVSTRPVEPEDSDRTLIMDPNVVASARLDGVTITSTDIDVFYDKPTGDAATNFVKEYKVFAERDIVTYVLTAYVKGIKYAAGAPRTFFKHGNSGHLLGLDTDQMGNIMHEFVWNNRKFDENSTSDATITNEFNAFGKLPCDYTNLVIDADFILLDGEHHRVVVDATNIVEIKQAADGLTKYYIHIEIELPEAIGTGEGIFDVEAEEWTDVDLVLPM